MLKKEIYDFRSLSMVLWITLKPQSNGPLYSNTVIGTLAVDGWAVIFGTAGGAWAGSGPAQSSPLYQM